MSANRRCEVDSRFRRAPARWGWRAPRIVVLAVAVAASWGAVLGCARPASDPPVASPARAYPGDLIEPSRILARHGGDFVTRQVISGAYGRQTFRFEAVLQKVGGEITVIGLTPMGTRAFVLRQRGSAITFERSFPGRAPFPPEYILNDIHRAFFWQAWEAFDPSLPVEDGERVVSWRGERVAERWREGRLRERHFARSSAGLCGEVVVRYEGGWALGEPVAVVVLDNAWFGYRLRIEQVDFRQL